MNRIACKIIEETPYRSHNFVNRDCDMHRVTLEMPKENWFRLRDFLLIDGDGNKEHIFPIQPNDDVYFIRNTPDGLNVMHVNIKSSYKSVGSIEEAYGKALMFIRNNSNTYGNLVKRDELYDICLKLSNDIAVTTKRGCGNYIIAPSFIIEEYIKQHNLKHGTDFPLHSKGCGRFIFWRKPSANNNVIIGYRGNKDNDAGIVIHVGETIDNIPIIVPVVNVYNTEQYYRNFQVNFTEDCENE